MTTLYFIRHGESLEATHNMIGDVGLSPFGVLQVERLRDRLAATNEINASLLISSTMLRAKETATILAPALGLPIVLDETVREWHPGEAEGMHQEEIQKKYGKDIPYLWSNPFQPLAPGGENWGQFALRGGTALDRIIRQYEGETIVIVCHGGIIELSFLYFSNMAMLQLPPVHYYNSPSSITCWRKVPFDGWPAGWRLVKHNDAMHLLGLEFKESLPWERLSRKLDE